MRVSLLKIGMVQRFKNPKDVFSVHYKILSLLPDEVFTRYKLDMYHDLVNVHTGVKDYTSLKKWEFLKGETDVEKAICAAIRLENDGPYPAMLLYIAVSDF